ncbi:MAG TPA: DMT family transporter [Candidatus Limnocylindrales bacterium]|nr:DMT family transporter [Candidatus Limnocylindrales bacterium]
MSGPIVAEPRTGRQHALAVGQALFVTFLWSTSWVLIKIGLDDLDLQPLSFAGLRYALAALVLAPFGARAIRAAHAETALGARLWLRMALYGLLFIAVAQGAQFAALAVLPATAVNLVLSSIPAVVALMALAGGSERARPAQAGGIGLLVLGAFLYFGPFELGPGAPIGLLAAGICVLASGVSAHLGRGLARDVIARLGGPIGLTAASMGIGAVALLATGLLVEGWPELTAGGWLIIGWLAVVNTAFAFTLWNHTLRTLTAVESSVVANTMAIQIAVLAIVFLGEQLGALQVLGLVLAALGALVVQLGTIPRRLRRPGPPRSLPSSEGPR